MSSLKVRFWATLFVGFLALLIPLLTDIKTSSDKESFVTILIVLGISLFVGIKKVRGYLLSQRKNAPSSEGTQ